MTTPYNVQVTVIDVVAADSPEAAIAGVIARLEAADFDVRTDRPSDFEPNAFVSDTWPDGKEFQE